MDKYFLKNTSDLKTYCNVYIPLIKEYSKHTWGINLEDIIFDGDHLGVQTSSAEEFDYYFNLLSSYMSHNFTNVLHNRRVSTFSFKEEIVIQGINIRGIEIFEPKPDTDINRLKLGIEHIAIVVERYERFLNDFPKEYIAKEVSYNEGCFFKTKFMNLVEIEFRDKGLVK